MSDCGNTQRPQGMTLTDLSFDARSTPVNDNGGVPDMPEFPWLSWWLARWMHDLGASIAISRGRSQWRVAICRHTATDLKVPLVNRPPPVCFHKCSYVLGAALDAALKAAACDDYVARAGVPSYFDEHVERFLQETRASIFARTFPVTGARAGDRPHLGWYVRIESPARKGAPFETVILEQPDGRHWPLQRVVNAAIEVAMERAREERAREEANAKQTLS